MAPKAAPAQQNLALKRQITVMMLAMERAGIAMPEVQKPQKRKAIAASGTEPKASIAPQKQQKSGDGWHTVVHKKQSDAKPHQDTLKPDGWSVPVAIFAELAHNKSGVALASVKQLKEALQRPPAIVPQAVLAPIKLDGHAAEEKAVIIQDKDDRTQTRQRFLYQLGSSPVEFATAVPRRVLGKDTVKVVLTLSAKETISDAWAAAEKAPCAAAKRWLQYRAGAVVLDTLPPTRRQAFGSAEIQVVALINTACEHTVLKKSGVDGVIVRPFYTTPEDSRRFKVVPLKDGACMSVALERAAWLGAKAFGVVPSRRSMGIRDRAEDYEEAVRLLRPVDHATLTGTLWEVSGFPLRAGRLSVKEFLHDWAVEPVYTFRQARTRTWVVRANEEPPHKLLQHDDGLVVVKEAAPRQRRPTPVQRWQPQKSTSRQTVVFPKSWASVAASPPPAPVQPAPARAAASPGLAPAPPAPAPAALAASTFVAARTSLSTEQQQLALGSGVVSANSSGSTNDLQAMIAAAVAAAVAPLQAQVGQLQAEFRPLGEDDDDDNDGDASMELRELADQQKRHAENTATGAGTRRRLTVAGAALG